MSQIKYLYVKRYVQITYLWPYTCKFIFGDLDLITLHIHSNLKNYTLTSPFNSDKVEWLHTTLSNGQDKLKIRINKQSLKVPDCQSAEEVSAFLNFRNAPSEMRRKIDSELHVAQTKTLGRRNLSLETYQFLSQLFAGFTF